jgi:hypothetical protein
MVNTLVTMHKLKGQQIDFAQAFPQEKLKEDIYLCFPAGFEHKNEKWALKLKRNLYGLKQASRNWFLKPSAIYGRLGFKQSKSDPCLHLRKDMIIVLYTDDCLLYARDTKEKDAFVKRLRNDYKLTLNDPNPIDDFLGIHFSHQENGELHMSQQGSYTQLQRVHTYPRDALKTRQHQQPQSCTQAKKDLLDSNPGTIHPLSDNLTTLHNTHDPTYILPFTNTHGFPKNPWPLTKRRLDESFTTCNAEETNHSS